MKFIFFTDCSYCHKTIGFKQDFMFSFMDIVLGYGFIQIFCKNMKYQGDFHLSFHQHFEIVVIPLYSHDGFRVWGYIMLGCLLVEF